MILSHWRIFTDTKRTDGAHRLTLKLQAHVDRNFSKIKIEDYHKGGHVVTFDISHESDDWMTTVYEVISIAQQMGHGWSISGFIDEVLDLTSTCTSIVGIKMVSCSCPRPATAIAK